MRQSVQALALVTFDVPAAMPAAAVADNIRWALANAKSAPCFSVSAEVRAVREEAAMFNSNDDQWETDKERPWDITKGGEHLLSVSVPFDHTARTSPMKPAAAAAMVVEALNFMAGWPVEDAAAKRIAELEAALASIRDIPACSNSDPDDMGEALDQITATASAALEGRHVPPSGHVATLCAAALAVVDAYGGDVPDWIADEVQELVDAMADVNHGEIGE